VDIEANLQRYLDGGIQPDERYASFDYCFNYFQSFRESGRISELASPEFMQSSCLQLGFYLASWGMLRGSAELLQKSARYLTPTIKVIAQTDKSVWEIDAHIYTDANVRLLMKLAAAIESALPAASQTLQTKIMLGVFGCVPAFDTNFKKGCKAANITQTFGPNALKQIGFFYADNAALLDSYRVRTIDFVAGESTARIYTRAKAIDMAFFSEGERASV
jgi:hypothetical protein